ncbi:MAG: M23 family metallopeptidase [Sphingomonadales bacterium]|nr:M23 family metallopeptidase [Sphingomonadales bacterium]
MSLFAKFRAGAVAAAVIGGLIGSPAFANSSANADIAAPLRAAQAAKQSALGSGDEEFRQLFASWRSMDGGNRFAAPAIAHPAVSIPSLMPVEGVHFTSGFGMRWHPVLGGHRQHKGVDLSAPVGTPIHAAADGVIGRADWFSSYGLYVAIEHGNALETRYGHMSRLNVAAGQFVHKGDVIGYVGTTGRSTGPHLHYEVRIAGEAVNPVPYLEGVGTGETAAEAVRLADAGDGETGDE